MLLFKKCKRQLLCSLNSNLKNAKMLRHTPNSELLFLLIEKGSKAKNWAQCLPRRFIAAPQASCKENQKRDGQSTQRQRLTNHVALKGDKTGMQAVPTPGAKASNGKQARERPSKSPFLKSFIVNIIANLSLCTFQAPSWSSYS